jgi:FkbM family methyltransferase
MKFSLQDTKWALAGMFGYLFGWRLFAPLHYSLVVLGLHGLGFDNRHQFSSTGEARFVKRVLARTNTRTCIDIGANVGNYSADLAKYLPGPVFAIEPLSSSFEKLKSKGGNIHPIRAAVGDENGTVKIFSKGEGWEGATVHKDFLEHFTVGVEEEVPLTKLDALIAEHSIRDIDFIKIDTEGNEMEVLKGMQTLLREAPPRFIQFEFNVTHMRRGHTLFALTRLLPGYEFYRLVPHGMVKIDPENHVSNVFLFCNIIAKRV